DMHDVGRLFNAFERKFADRHQCVHSRSEIDERAEISEAYDGRFALFADLERTYQLLTVAAELFLHCATMRNDDAFASFIDVEYFERNGRLHERLERRAFCNASLRG